VSYSYCGVLKCIFYFFQFSNLVKLMLYSHNNRRYGGAVYAGSEMSHKSYPSDRNPGPLGDLYTSVDRTKDAGNRYSFDLLIVKIELFFC